MNAHDISEEAYKNGYEDGYVRGVLDRTAEVMKGTIEWHEGIPNVDLPFCYICQASGTGRHVIKTARYIKDQSIYIVDEFTEGDGSYVQRRLNAKDVRYYAKLKDPFSMRITFTVPEATA